MRCWAKGSAQYVFVAVIATSVDLDLNRATNWVDMSGADNRRLIAQGKVDAYLAFPPDAQALRSRKIGHTLLNSATDRSRWQYFCRLLLANQEFVRKNPITTKRAARAILKASEICASDPASA